MREKPTWANVEWLGQNVLAGQGTVSECQRKTKAWSVLEVANAASGKCYGHVRKVFRADAGGFAAWVSGTTDSAPMSYLGLTEAAAFVGCLLDIDEVAAASVPLFTSDPATGDWDALVLFERRAR